MLAYPSRIHGMHFTVPSRNGSRPAIGEQGLRGSIVAQEPVERLVKLSRPAEAAPFQYHGHILEYKVDGMMGRFSASQSQLAQGCPILGGL